MHTEGAAYFEIGHRFAKVHDFRPDEVRAFAALAGDTNPLHHDDAVAGQSQFGALIVSGTHTTALLLGLTASHFAEYGSVVGVGFTIQFVRPVLADARVHIEWQVTAVMMKTHGRQLLDLRGAITDAQARICVSATGQVMIGRER